MEYETISKETPEMKQLISGIRNLTKRVRATAQTHRPLFGGELYLTGREVCERLFLSPRTLQDYRDKGPQFGISKACFCLKIVSIKAQKEDYFSYICC